jgi:hypothetical protein
MLNADGHSADPVCRGGGVKHRTLSNSSWGTQKAKLLILRGKLFRKRCRIAPAKSGILLTEAMQREGLLEQG